MTAEDFIEKWRAEGKYAGNADLEGVLQTFLDAKAALLASRAAPEDLEPKKEMIYTEDPVRGLAPAPAPHRKRTGGKAGSSVQEDTCRTKPIHGGYTP